MLASVPGNGSRSADRPVGSACQLHLSTIVVCSRGPARNGGQAAGDQAPRSGPLTREESRRAPASSATRPETSPRACVPHPGARCRGRAAKSRPDVGSRSRRLPASGWKGRAAFTCSVVTEDHTIPARSRNASSSCTAASPPRLSKPFAQCDGDRTGHGLTGQSRQLASEPTGLFVLDVQAHFLHLGRKIGRPSTLCHGSVVHNARRLRGIEELRLRHGLLHGRRRWPFPGPATTVGALN